MPQLELKYTQDITLNAPELLTKLAKSINDFDPDAGVCKCRAVKVETYQPSHVLLHVALMPREHRDDDWMRALGDLLEGVLYEGISTPCHLAIELRFLSPHYRSYAPL